MIILKAQNISKSYGSNRVLENVQLTLQSGQRMGLVGVNGCGKTTLLNILTGREECDGGDWSIQKGLRIGYLKQKMDFSPEKTVFRVLEDVFEPVQIMENRLRAYEQQLAECTDEAEIIRISEAYSKLQERFENEDGYARQSLIQGALTGMGFDRTRWEQKTGQLSGGELTRLGLAALLLSKPDLLLLDEPTNHLDLSAIDWLEKYLVNYGGAILVISHDRYFLDRVCTDITEILLGVSEYYHGNYTAYMNLRAERFEARMKAYEQQQAEIARQQAVIEKLRSFNREKSIRRAESRQKALNRIERLERPDDEKQIHFSFSVLRKTGEDVLDVRGLSKSFGNRTLFQDVQLKMNRGDRIALIGPNGIGKTTLMRCILGQEKPDSGTIRWGANVDLGYYDQLQQALHPEKTVLREVWDDFVRMTQTQIRGALGKFLFTGDEVFSPISSLSGGERGCVLLTKLMLRRDNVLFLDEPTNHLDADSREVLEDALEEYEGTILAISHDRYFINRFANKIAEMTSGGIRVFQGNYDEYLRCLEKERADILYEEGNGGITKTEAQKQKRFLKNEAERKKQLEKALNEAEKRVEQCEKALRDQEEAMTNPELMARSDALVSASLAYEQMQKELSGAYSAWEEAQTRLDEYRKEHHN